MKEVLGWVVAITTTLTVCACGSSGGGGGNGGGGMAGPPSGSLDTTFSGSGFATRVGTAGGTNDVGNAVVVDSQGAIVTAGQSNDVSGNYHVTLSRYTAAGLIDPTFNSFGSITQAGNVGAQALANVGMALDSQDRMLVTGISTITRYTTAGILDTAGFNAPSGFLSIPGPGAFANSVSVDSFGRILVVGYFPNALNTPPLPQMAVWRYTSAGVLDTSFNPPNGYVINSGAAGGNLDIGFSVAVDSLSRIVVAGTSRDAGFKVNLAIWRYTNAGALDLTLNGTGHVTRLSTAGGTRDQGVAVALDGQGRIVVAGYSQNAGGFFDLAIWRYTDTGAPDSTFNGTGSVTKRGTAGGINDQGFALALDSQGRIVVAGLSNDINGISNLAVWRYTSDGVLDTTFNSPNGFATKGSTSGGPGDQGAAVALDRQGRIVVAGQSADVNGHTRLTLWRLYP